MFTSLCNFYYFLNCTSKWLKIKLTVFEQAKSLTFLVMIILSACSSSSKDVDDFKVQVDDKFTTYIVDSEIKLFSYRAKVHHNSISSKAQNIENWTEQVELGLIKTIEMSGYCKEGYIELSRFITYGEAEIRGECNEGATAEDITKFDS